MPFERIIDMDTLDWVRWIGLFGCSSWIGIYALILLHRIKLHIENLRKRRTIQRWEPIIIAAAFDPPSVVSQLNRSNWIDFFEIWQKALMTLKGDAQDHLVQLARDTGLYRHARRELRFGFNFTRRKQAITVLGWLGSDSDWKLLDRYLANKDNAISFAAARALTRLNSEKALPLVIHAIAEGANWPSNLIAAILLEAGPDLVSASFLYYLHQGEERSISPLVPFFRYGNEALVSYVLQKAEMLKIPSREYALILEQCRDPSSLSSLRCLINHDSPDIRLAVVKALRALAEPSDAAVLRKTLSDPVWRVRYAAAHALRDLVRPDPAALEAESLLVESTEARAVLQHVMAEAWL